MVLGGSMAWSQDAIRLYEQDLLQKADMVAIGLKGLRAADPGRAAAMLTVISERLEGATLRDAAPALMRHHVGEAPALRDPAPPHRGNQVGEAPPPQERQRPLLVASRGGGAEDIEDFILDIL